MFSDTSANENKEKRGGAGTSSSGRSKPKMALKLFDDERKNERGRERIAIFREKRDP